MVTLFPYETPHEAVKAQEKLTRSIEHTSDDQVLEADPETWAKELAASLALPVPSADLDQATIEDLGSTKVDATGMGGITYTSSEIGGRLIRDGVKVRLTVPTVEGQLLVQVGGPLDADEFTGRIDDDQIVREFEWPVEKGSGELQRQIDGFKASIKRAAESAGPQIEEFNRQLEERALKLINERRQRVLKHREFLGELKVPVKKAVGAPKQIKAPVRAKETPARKRKEAAKAGEPTPIGGAELDELYEQTLVSIRAMGHAMERAPEGYRSKDEETLRDHLLVILNTHFEGLTYGEAFNKGGKTDVMIRVEDKPVLLAECKWWSGEKGMEAALEQLYSYATWRDSRLALIFFVVAKDISAIVAKAKALIEGRAEYLGSVAGAEENEIRCRIRWPDDPEREATLTILLFHLPK